MALTFQHTFAALLFVALQRFSEDANIFADLVHLQERRASFGPETALKCLRRAVCGMLNADDASNVSRSVHGLELMMVILGCLQHFWSDCLEEEGRDHVRSNSATLATPIVFNTLGQQYRLITSFIYLGSAVIDISLEVDRRIRAGWINFNRFWWELLDDPDPSLFNLKVRMVKPEVVEALRYDYVSWAFHNIHYNKLRTAHHRMLLRILGAVDDRSVTRTVSLDLYCGIDRSSCSFEASRFILVEMIKRLPRIVEFGLL